METTYLLLADGTSYRGQVIGVKGTAYGPLVLRSGAVGDIHALTDPCYQDQILMETFPLVGNVGWIPEEAQSKSVTPKAYVVNRLCATPSHARCQAPLQERLQQALVVGIQGIDTRALARKVRDTGPLACAITPDPASFDVTLLQESLWEFPAPDLARREAENLASPKAEALPLAVLDFGIRRGLVQSLLAQGFDLTLYPATTPAETILAAQAQGIFLSPGPGNPKAMEDVLGTIRTLREADLPILGMGLGHALLASSYGFDVTRIDQGQHGFHRPLRQLATGKPVYGMQNLPYGVRLESVAQDVAQITYDDPMTGTVQGLFYPKIPAWTSQFETQDPELLGRFYDAVKEASYALG